MLTRILLFISTLALTTFAQTPAGPPIEPGVSHDLAKWRAAHYSDVRYKLNLTLEKMSPTLKGSIEIRVVLSEPPASAGGTKSVNSSTPIILDWRRIRGSESLSTISNVTINGVLASASVPPANAGGSDKTAALTYEEHNEHLIFRDGVVAGENVIKLDFTSPILTSGSAITRYVDKEDGAEYIYSLFVPSDASTAFPVFDQPDLKARFTLQVVAPKDWRVISNGEELQTSISSAPDWKLPLHRPTPDLVVNNSKPIAPGKVSNGPPVSEVYSRYFNETKPISTYVFAFAAGPFERVSEPPALAGGTNAVAKPTSGPTTQRPSNATSTPPANAGGSDKTSIFVRKSQAAKFKPHAAEVFRLNREGIKYLETYFDYKFPFPKYDIVLIPEFPFGGMEHAGATFLREASVIFPQEPTKNDYISRANVIFHEAAHQWFGDTVTMKWFDDLWLKEGFAEFMAYKTLETVMPEYNAWKVFYERNKQAAYLTDSTKGTTPIYQEIANLNSAKSAYGNIVYRKAPSFLKQAEFYLGPDKFQTAVRAFLKKHEYANAGWEDLVKEFEKTTDFQLKDWGRQWVKAPGLTHITNRPYRGIASVVSSDGPGHDEYTYGFMFDQQTSDSWPMKTEAIFIYKDGSRTTSEVRFEDQKNNPGFAKRPDVEFVFGNFRDYGYGIFLLDDKSRDYVLKNIQNEKDDFLRTMMWGSLWDSVREAELAPKEYVELVIKNIGSEQDESTIQTLLGRVSTAMRYYMSEPPALAGGTNAIASPTLGPTTQSATKTKATPPAHAGGSDKMGDLNARLESLLIDRMQRAPTPGQRITYYRAFLGLASSNNSRNALKQILAGHLKGNRRITPTAPLANDGLPTLRTKDKFDIVTRLMVLSDVDAPKLLAQLEKTETSDEARRYAYAARAGLATPENKAKYWNDFTTNKDTSESWIEAAFVPFNATSHADLTLPYLERALAELPNLKRSRKIFFINGWLSAFIGGQRSEQALAIINKFLADNPNLDKDLRLKILENSDLIERAVKIRGKFKSS